jgi:phospholipase/carboxylesterase
VNSEFRQRTLGPLIAIEKRGHPDMPWVVLFHGYGADASDLAPLANVIPAPKGLNWLFPEGPLSVPIGPMYFGRAWFPIDMGEIERAAQLGETRDMSDRTPDGLKEARAMVHAAFQDLGIPLKQMVVGGFSQGAMLATDYCLHEDATPRGLLLLSSTLLNRSIWARLATEKPGLKFFQSHGTNDPILGYKQAKDLYAVLKDAGLDGSLTTFAGGHEIPGQVVEGIGQFLHDVM